MANTGRIRVNFDKLKTNYFTFSTLPKPLQDFMNGLNKITPGNTPCCIQVSHALNQTGQYIPATSFRRANSCANRPVDSHYYILAVDELEQYLSGRYGRGENIKSGHRTTDAAMKQYLNGKQGILIFGGLHTELWDKTHILQDGMPIPLPGGGQRPGALMSSSIWFKPRVLFWDVGEEEQGLIPVPTWLQGWWNVNDGETYFYHFSDQHLVTYTKVKPKNVLFPPVKQPMNEGDVTVLPNSMQVVIDWNPADGGATKETFTRLPTTTESMNGVSNRYSPLSATKMK